MFETLRGHLLRLLRVPHDPDPPIGAPGSLRVFRAGRNFYKLRLLGWALAQFGALVGILFSLQALDWIEDGVRGVTTEARPAPPRPTAEATPPSAQKGKKRASRDPVERARETMQRFGDRAPWWLFTGLRVFEALGIALYLLQIPITYAMVRLDFELRWYMVTDRSLRIRAGLASVLESTMSFANVQQVVVTQGPLQRLLGLADVRVQSAGGGGDHHEKEGGGDSLHTGVFHAVENATQIRDLILERLRLFRAAGLGEPDDTPAATPAPTAANSSAEVLAAAREVLAETRALRQALR